MSKKAAMNALSHLKVHDDFIEAFMETHPAISLGLGALIGIALGSMCILMRNLIVSRMKIAEKLGTPPSEDVAAPCGACQRRKNRDSIREAHNQEVHIKHAAMRRSVHSATVTELADGFQTTLKGARLGAERGEVGLSLSSSVNANINWLNQEKQCDTIRFDQKPGCDSMNRTFGLSVGRLISCSVD